MTNQELINKALATLRVVETGQAASAGDSAIALDALNRMCAEWKNQSKDLNWFPQDTLGDTVPVEDWALNALIYGLAVYSAPEFNATVTATVGGMADHAIGQLENVLINLSLDGADMTHLPLGDTTFRTNIETGQ